LSIGEKFGLHSLSRFCLVDGRQSSAKMNFGGYVVNQDLELV
jgi:hypothetical protein